MHPATDSSKENRHETEIIARPGTLFYCCASLSGRVTFETEEGDSLNLKSALCLFVFTAASRDHFANLSGEVVCQVSEDEALLVPFAEADG